MRTPASHQARVIELCLLFVFLPIFLILPVPMWLRVGFAVFGFLYVLVLLVRSPHISIRSVFAVPQNHAFWYRLGLLFAGVVGLSTWYVTTTDPSLLLTVPTEQPWFWFLMVLIYSFLSVFPQELVYRTFFFDRYRDLFRNDYHLILVNAALFSLCHIILRSPLVLVLTFMGGVFFAFTYLDTKSTVLVSVEHALYGSWLFTVGMGAMLAFPS